MRPLGKIMLQFGSLPKTTPSAHGPIFYGRQKKNRSENRFVCADFWSDRKSDLSFPKFVCDVKSVRVRLPIQNRSDVIQQLDIAYQRTVHNNSDKISVRVRQMTPIEICKVDPMFCLR